MFRVEETSSNVGPFPTLRNLANTNVVEVGQLLGSPENAARQANKLGTEARGGLERTQVGGFADCDDGRFCQWQSANASTARCSPGRGSGVVMSELKCLNCRAKGLRLSLERDCGLNTVLGK
jgi:hypothetical protein